MEEPGRVLGRLGRVVERTVVGQDVDPQTEDRTTLATLDVDVSAIAWSPDGKGVVYTATGLESVDLGSGEITRLTDLVGDVNSIGWSPDGTRLVLDDLLAGRDRVVVMNADGSDQRVLVDQHLADVGVDGGHAGSRVARTAPSQPGASARPGTATTSPPVIATWPRRT